VRAFHIAGLAAVAAWMYALTPRGGGIHEEYDFGCYCRQAASTELAGGGRKLVASPAAAQPKSRVQLNRAVAIALPSRARSGTISCSAMPIIDATTSTSPISSADTASSGACRAKCRPRVPREAIGQLMDSMDVVDPNSTVQSLKHAAAELRKRKKELSRQLRNASRQNKRLKEKAKLLSNEDLLAVICMRHAKAGAGTDGHADSHARDDTRDNRGSDQSAASASSEPSFSASASFDVTGVETAGGPGTD
jgi:hypothetical protein